MTKYFTDYPVEQFGDRPHHAAPFRPCVPIAYDGDKYVVCDVKERGTSCRMTIKSGYIKKTRSKNPKSVAKHRHVRHLEVDADTFWALEEGVSPVRKSLRLGKAPDRKHRKLTELSETTNLPV